MIIAIDVDNVINNLQEVVIKLFNKRYNTKYTVADFTEYNVDHCLTKDHAAKMQAMYGESGLYDHVKPLAMAQKSLQKLVNDGHSVYLVTDSIADTYGEKVAWIKHYFDCIDDSHIICMKHKWLLRCDVMIEDKYDTLIAKPYYHRQRHLGW